MNIIEQDNPISDIENIQKIVRKEIRDRIFGIVRNARWKLKLNINSCAETCFLHLVKNGDQITICDLNDKLIELSHERHDKTLGEDLVDDLLTLSVKDLVRQEVVRIWGEIGPRPGERNGYGQRSSRKNTASWIG